MWEVRNLISKYKQICTTWESWCKVKHKKKNNCSRKVASQETFLLWLSVYFAFFVVVSFKSNNILGNSCDYTRYQERWRTEDPINRSDDREGRHGGEKVLGLR